MSTPSIEVPLITPSAVRSSAMDSSLLEAPGLKHDVVTASCSKLHRTLRMSKFSSDFMRVLEERGYIYQCSDPEGLDAKARSGEIIAYVGYDCTAPSLHVGSLISIMMLRWLQQFG